MHDTHLIQKIGAKVLKLCGEKKIGVLNELEVSVHKDSHVTVESLAAFIKGCSPWMVDDKTNIRIIRDGTEEHLAVIRAIDGTGSNL